VAPKKGDELSPFELKDQLIEIASSHADQMMLNAGRGNPNFLATHPRHAFLRLGDFAVKEAERSYSYLNSGFGGLPEKQGIVSRFDTYCMLNEGQDGLDFLRASLAFAEDHIGLSKQEFLFEMTSAFLGGNYPVPPRMLESFEKVVNHYLAQEMYGSLDNDHDFDLFATEGGTAAMTYIFQTLKANGLTKPKDKIALVTPIFSPYLEIPVLPEYDLEIVDIRADEGNGWQLPASEIKKLEDPDIKILCVVNPSNPPSVKMSADVLKRLSDLVSKKRPDLMIVTDDVYATFSDNFESLFAVCPYNTLCVYSFSKYFGATGWRLGVIGVHADNIFDDSLAKLSGKALANTDRRYASLTDQPRALRFIDRLVADSRAVALNHTAGLSLPQQLQMTLFALAGLLDEDESYKGAAKRLIRRRHGLLYQALGVSPQITESDVDYYTLLDLEVIGRQLYGAKFAAWLLKREISIEFLFRLARETSVVLLPGKGFEDTHPSARVSLANLRENDYIAIGKCTRKVLDEYYQEWKSQKK